ncbi:hypothetical protein XM38_020520 [Halomicronema hongdechloris C2206]|uniref:Uncharacterized protein n=1 Tax=Halomicronema hongdechloris C2206 TaxID=1641165 RepID=A0A1Z3HLA6_9CYAN|nr:hypothetical protein [Halomicronema hongdechloris]ASC71102.1 hypothetical protein XM38_020520 [Halomicronema hongdechloris C2206]
MDDFEVVWGEAVEVGNAVIDLCFPPGHTLVSGAQALLHEGGDGGFVGVGGGKMGIICFM